MTKAIAADVPGKTSRSQHTAFSIPGGGDDRPKVAFVLAAGSIARAITPATSRRRRSIT
jgi:hypothetical protein